MHDAALWASCADGNVDARNALLTQNLSLVHHVARKLARGMAVDADLDEMVSAGTLGLMNALESFDASRGLAFSTYAVTRIRGAILDELRRQDHVPRSIRRKARDIAAARETLTRTFGRAPDDAEIARELAVDVATVWRWQAEAEGAVYVPLDRQPSDDDASSPAPATWLSDAGDGADVRIARAEEFAQLRDALMSLKDQDRTVLSLCYFEELKLHEIADILGLTDSRVSQIRSRALARLRERMAPLRAIA